MKPKISPPNKSRPKDLILFLTLLCMTLSLTSCDKYKQACCTCEVPYSETGAGTMGCQMDGEAWAVCDVAKERLVSNAILTRENINGFDFWQIVSSKNFNGGTQTLFFNLVNPVIGIISTKNPLHGSLRAEFFTKVSTDYNGIFILDTNRYSRLEITKFDTINRIISGRFECTLIENDGGLDTTTIKVTNGVFDTKY